MTALLYIPLTIAAFLPVFAAGAGEPYTPLSGSEVLQVVPRSLIAIDELKELRQAFRQHPKDSAAAVELAQALIAIGRSSGDPRYYGYAQATLSAWWQQADPPPDVRLVRASLHQTQHRFNEATEDLHAVLRAQPRNAQAWWILATVRRAVGDFDGARAACSAFSHLANLVLSGLCYADVLSITGGAERAYEMASYAQSRLHGTDELQQWILSLMGECAWRMNQPKHAEQHFKAALSRTRHDPYSLRVYADFLLQQHRPAEALQLLEDETANDALLLRAAMAASRLQRTAQVSRYREQLESRYTAARLRGSTTHYQDEALYALEFGNPRRALPLARENWNIQKGIDDSAILLRAALASQAYDLARKTAAWVNQHQLQDPRIETLLERVAKL